jgi:hypothetical protein
MQTSSQKRRNGFASLLLAGLVATHSYTAVAQSTTMKAPVPVAFGAFNDPWPAGRERWLDISDAQYQDWSTSTGSNGKYSYRVNPNVVLTYDTAPATPYFQGRIDATGLKPNFCYQLKLVGKPVHGSRGMGKSTSWKNFDGVTQQVGSTPVNGDDWANEQIGFSGRWWDDTNQSGATNTVDGLYLNAYKTPVQSGSSSVSTVYGYQFMGSFVTNGKGEAHVNFSGQYSYHIDWKATQGGRKDVWNGTFPVTGWLLNSNPTFYYGYGATAPATSVDLWYELETARNIVNQNGTVTAKPVNLKPGKYHCRFILTEESFHASSTLGGYWESVLATEDFAGGVADSNAANDVVFTIGGAAVVPAAPTGFSAIAGSTQVALKWDSTPDATSYTVKRWDANFQEYVAIASGITTSYTDYEVTNGTTYSYILVASNVGGEGAATEPITATPQSVLPTIPANLTATAVSAKQIDLAWSDSSNEDGYKIERSLDGTNFTYMGPVAGNVTSYASTALTAGTTYYYRIYAYNSDGTSAYSATVSQTTLAPPPAPPAAPSTLTVAAVSKTQVNLSWTDRSSNEDGFKIERSLNGTTFVEVDSVGPNVRTYSNTGLVANTTYSYRVRAFNQGGYSAYSNVVKIKTPNR